MTCPEPKLILRLVSGELAPDEERMLREHIKDCSACQLAHAELQETWRTLGAWEVQASDVDLTEAVLHATDADESQAVFGGSQILQWPVLLRTAASIGIAAGLGVAAGYLVPVGADRSQQASHLTVETDEVLEALGLTLFGVDSATSLSLGLGVEEPVGGEEASS